MATTGHAKIIDATARQILSPHGLMQKGKSRTWYDDHGIYTIIVEFQPHKWSHGAFLNVGVNFHWYVQSHISFDMGYRESQFEKFETANGFTKKIEAMVHLALEKTFSYRQKLIRPDVAKQNILAHTFSSDELWGNYHRGVICGLTADVDGLFKHFDAAIKVDHDVQWANDLKAKMQALKVFAADETKFRSEIVSMVLEARKLKQLQTMDIVY